MIFHASCLGATIDDKGPIEVQNSVDPLPEKQVTPNLTEKQLDAMARMKKEKLREMEEKRLKQMQAG